MLNPIDDSGMERIALISCALWNIWKARHEKVCQDKHLNILVTATNHVDIPKERTTSSSFAKGWRFPHGDCIKINCDTRFDGKSGSGTVSAICSKGGILTGATDHIFAASPLMV